MNRNRISILSVVLIVSVSLLMITMLSVSQAATDWEAIADGIDYQEFVLTDPLVHIHVARMNRNNPNLILDSMLGQGRLSGGVEQVSGMAERYDQSLTTWGDGFGDRSDVVVAINGYYFGSPNEDAGIPWNGQFQNGWHAKRFFYENGAEPWPSGFGFLADRSLLIGNSMIYQTDKQYIDFESGATQFFQGINRERGSNDLVIYTPQYDRTTLTNDNGVEVIVQMIQPVTIALARNAILGTVLDIRENQGNSPIAFDQIVISASGTAANTLLNNLEIDEDDATPGVQIAIAQKINDAASNDWQGAFSGMGIAFHFLSDRVVNPFTNNPQAVVQDPRTAIAYENDYVFFIVADGRDPGVSEGMTIEQLGDFAKDQLGATDGFSLDGGGSSTMWVDGQVVNTPSDACPPGLFLPYIANGPESQAEATPEQAEANEADVESATTIIGCQRWVANGMMMVSIQDEINSTSYEPGDFFEISQSDYLRLGPGENQNVSQWIISGSEGSVIAHTKGLTGVLATNDYWWYVDIDGEQGWIEESAISPTIRSLERGHIKANN